MKIIGLTGGIGSGKTTVAKMFANLGAPIYIADDEAKKLTNLSQTIKTELTKLLGNEAYVHGNLNRTFVASKIFNDKILLEKTNKIIHPEVKIHFEQWIKNKDFPYCIKEAAILFENGSYLECSSTILVLAPLTIRIQRVMDRDNVTEKEVIARIKTQWSNAKKRKFADFIIRNDDLEEVEKRVIKLHKKFSE